MKRGTVKLARSLWDDEAFPPAPFSQREAWMWLVAFAAYAPHRRMVGKFRVDLERGQIAASVRYLGLTWRWSKSAVDRFICKLRNRDMIGTVTGTGVMVITLRKYDDYQDGGPEAGTGVFREPGHVRDKIGVSKEERDKYGGGGYVREREDSDPDQGQREAPPIGPTFAAALLEAAGSRPPGSRLGGAADLRIVTSWLAGGASEAEILAVVREVRAGMAAAPSSLRYFGKAVARLLGAKAEPPLAPAAPQSRPEAPVARPAFGRPPITQMDATAAARAALARRKTK